jgi:hypothetical protein
MKALSYDAYDEYRRLSAEIEALNRKISERDLKIAGMEKDIQNFSYRISDLVSVNLKLENKQSLIEADLKKTVSDRSDLANEVAMFRQAEQLRLEDYNKNVAGINAIQAGLEKERKDIADERVRKKEEEFEKKKLTWQTHEETVESAIRSICKTHFIEYVKDVPFRGNPDNTILIAGEYIIFDAKSPAGDDLENFPKYLKLQAEAVKKYIKQENVKNDIFLVVPSNTLETLRQFSYNMGDYNTYVISVDALEPVILSLKKIENYEFAEQLLPDERENICRIIGKFAHTAKRKIQIDYFFSYQFLEILSKCNVDLPEDIIKSVQEFEKAEKINPPQEKRAKQILTEELIRESERLAIETRAKLIEEEGV